LNTMLTVSIITASFRSESTIVDTLKSLNEQTYPAIEHLVVDGASTDRTLELVREHGKRVARLVSEPDKGIYDAFNKGLAMATGDVIGFLNSDDFYASPDVIAAIMEVFNREQDVDAVYADLVYVEKTDKSTITRYWKSRPYRRGDFTRAFCPPHPTLFLRRSVYDRTGGFDAGFRYAGDYEYMLRAFHTHEVKSRYLAKIAVMMRNGGTTGGSWVHIKNQNVEIFRALEHARVPVSRAGFMARKIVDRLLQRLRARFVRLPG
jgi:glycosyltransferase involved in cell wall biosynthesis